MSRTERQIDGDNVQEGSPRALAQDYQLALLAHQQIVNRRGNDNNREARAAKRKADDLAVELAAKILGIREAGALLEGIDRRDAPQATRPKNSVIRTGWVRHIQQDDVVPLTEQTMVSDTGALWTLQQKIFNVKMDLLSEAVGRGEAIISDPVIHLNITATAKTVPSEMYVGRAPDGYGSYLPTDQNEIHWYEERS